MMCTAVCSHHEHKPPMVLTASQYDPTHTLYLRNAFVAQMNKRFRALRGAIRRAIVDLDCFGLGSPSPFRTTFLSTYSGISLPSHGQFAFPRSADKIEAFMTWLRTQEEVGILEISTFQQSGRAIEQAWTNQFVTDSYSRGVERARAEMRNADIPVPDMSTPSGISGTLFAPVHLDRVGVLYTRVFRDLKGITEAMDNQISRVLAQGMMDGKNPRELARLLTRTISGPVGDLSIKDALGRFIPAERRARTLARTEIVRAHHLGNIQEMRNWGVEGVSVMVEWSTAGYNVCPECSALSGRTFTLDQIEGMIPMHPNCRCCAIPIPPGA